MFSTCELFPVIGEGLQDVMNIRRGICMCNSLQERVLINTKDILTVIESVQCRTVTEITAVLVCCVC